MTAVAASKRTHRPFPQEGLTKYSLCRQAALLAPRRRPQSRAYLLVRALPASLPHARPRPDAYGLLQDASGLHAIWGQGSTTAMAALSLAVVGGFALLLSAASIRVFSRSAVR